MEDEAPREPGGGRRTHEEPQTAGSVRRLSTEQGRPVSFSLDIRDLPINVNNSGGRRHQSSQLCVCCPP